jgi:hypothetical protein
MQTYKPGDTIVLPHYDTAGGPSRKRVWKVSAVYLGATHQESVYELSTVDLSPTDFGPMMLVPCIMLESHPGVVRV